MRNSFPERKEIQAPHKNILQRKQSMSVATIILLIANLLKSFSMLINNIVIAAIFGASYLTDGFLLAYLVTVRFGMAMSLCINFVYIPSLAEFNVRKGKEEVNRLINAFVNNIFLLSLLGTILFLIIAPWVIKVLCYSINEMTLEVIINSIRVLTPSLFFFMAFALFQAFLYSHKHFLVPAVGSILPPIGILVGAVFFSKILGIYSLALGLVFGTLLQFVIQIPAVRSMGFKYSPILKWSDPNIRRMRRDVELMVIIVALSQVVVTIDKMFASTLDEGSVSALTFSSTILRLAPTLLQFSLLTSALPTLTEYLAKRELTEFQILFNRLLRLIALAMIPCTVLFFFVGLPLIQLIYEHGKFNEEASLLTFTATKYYAIGFFAFSLQGPFIQALYLLRKFTFILVWTIITIGFTIVLNYAFLKSMGFAGLPLAYSICMFIHLAACYISLKFYIKDFKLHGVAREFTVMIISGILMVLSLKMVSPILLMPFFPQTGIMAILLKIIIPGIVGIIVYLGALFVFRSRDLQEILDKVFLMLPAGSRQEEHI